MISKLVCLLYKQNLHRFTRNSITVPHCLRTPYYMINNDNNDIDDDDDISDPWSILLPLFIDTLNILHWLTLPKTN